MRAVGRRQYEQKTPLSKLCVQQKVSESVLLQVVIVLITDMDFFRKT